MLPEVVLWIDYKFFLLFERKILWRFPKLCTHTIHSIHLNWMAVNSVHFFIPGCSFVCGKIKGADVLLEMGRKKIKLGHFFPVFTLVHPLVKLFFLHSVYEYLFFVHNNLHKLIQFFSLPVNDFQTNKTHIHTHTHTSQSH